MAFLRVNGWTVPVFDASPVLSHERSGRRGRSFRGQARDARRHIRRSWRCRACFLDHGDAVALERLLLGEGHLIDFAHGVEASTSLMPGPGYSQVLRLSPGSWGAYGKGFAHVATSVTGDVVTYDAQLGDDWTILVRRFDAATQQFIGHAQRSDGTAYVDGAVSSVFGLPATIGGLTFRFVVRGGVVALVKDGTSVDELFDDLVLLPWRATDGQLAAWTGRVSTVPKWGPMPTLRVDGDMIDPDGGTRLAVGEVRETSVVQGLSRIEGLGWVNNARVVTFTLDEVDPICVREIEDDVTATPVPPGAPIAWYAADNVDGMRNVYSVQGQEVADWYDGGSRGSGLTQATGASRPALHLIATPARLGNAAAVRFDGTADFMATAAAAPNVVSPVTIAAVWRTTTVAAGTAYVLDRASGAGFRASLFRAAAVQTIGAESNTATHATALVAGNWNASVAVLRATLSEHRLNGVAETESTDLSDASGTAGFTLGAVAGGGSYLAGDIAEVLVWGVAVDLDAVQTYLEARHGAFPG